MLVNLVFFFYRGTRFKTFNFFFYKFLPGLFVYLLIYIKLLIVAY